VCYNPLFHAEKIKVCTVESTARNILEELKVLKNRYTEKVHSTQICELHEWICFGSEEEVEYAKHEFREDRVCTFMIQLIQSALHLIQFDENAPDWNF